MQPRNPLRMIIAHKRLIIACVVVITGIAVVATFLRTPTYKGQAQILLTVQETGTALLGSESQVPIQLQRYLETQVKVMESRPVVEAVIKSAQLRTDPEQLLKRVKFVADGQTDIVTVEVIDTSANRAADIANAFAKTYVVWSRDLQSGSIKAAADDIEKRLALLQKQITAIQAAAPPGGVAGTQQLQLSAAKQQYSVLSDRLNELRTNEGLATGSGSILSTAFPDTKRVAPSHVLDTGLGLVIGLIFGVGMAFVAETLDTTIKSAEEAAHIYGAPVMGNIPTEKFNDDDASRLTLVQHPGSHAAEAYRVLRTNLNFVNSDFGIKTLLITSATPEEGKSTVAANLATALSQAGKKVVLVICDFHRPSSAKFFDVDHATGLSDVLSGSEDEVRLQQPSGRENLLVLTSGGLPSNPSELLGSERMGKLIGSLGEQADWVILDSPPLLALADAAATARWADGVLVVARIGLVTSDAARKAREQLDKVGARVLGVAVWDLEEGSEGHGYYGYDAYKSK